MARLKYPGGAIRLSFDIIDNLDSAVPTSDDLIAFYEKDSALAKKVRYDSLIGKQKQVITADGAITILDGIVVITKVLAAALTLALPTATIDDFDILRIISTTAVAHTITTPALGLNATYTVATFGSNIGDSITLLAYQGSWYVLNMNNVDIS